MSPAKRDPIRDSGIGGGPAKRDPIRDSGAGGGPARRDAPRSDDREQGFVQFDDALLPQADPAVASILSRREQVQGEARLPKKAREKKIKERERMAARRAEHTTYDLPPELRAWVKSLSEELGIPASQIATLALLRFAQEYQAGQVDLKPYKRASQSPRFDWNLSLRLEDFGVGKRKK